MAFLGGFLPSYGQMTVMFGRGMRLSWAVIFVAVIAIVVSNYIHEINSEIVDGDKDICDGIPQQREVEGQGHMCTLMNSQNFVTKRMKSPRSLLEVFCRQGKRPFLHQFFSTGLLDIRCEDETYEVVRGVNGSEVRARFSELWSIKIIHYPAFLKNRYRISPFNDTCIGLVHRPTCMVAYSFHALDVSLVAFFLLGLFLFFSADSLSKNTMLYYGSGVGMGVLMSLVIVMFVFSRFMYKRTGFLLAITVGWSGVLYVFALMYDHMESLVKNYQTYIIGYTTVMSLISFYVCYWWGPPSSPRTLDIIRWTVQAVGIGFMLNASHAPLFIRLTVVFVILTIYFFPTKSVSKMINATPFIYRFFPPKTKLLTEEEFILQGSVETRKALEQLREYCKSPDCNAWKTISRVKTPQRLAAFVEGNSHLSDEEVLDYESDPQPLLTDDEDLSDDDLHFQLGNSFDS